MKVKEIIAELQLLDQEEDVYVSNSDYEQGENTYLISEVKKLSSHIGDEDYSNRSGYIIV